MDFIKDILRGMLIGVANVIPGVSGGTMAVSMGIYDKIINAITNLKKEFKKSFVTLLPYGIGIIIGVIGLAFLIEMLFEKYQLPTVACFLGLILGGLPVIVKKVENEKFKFTHLVSFVLFVSVIVFLTLFSTADVTSHDIPFGMASIILMMFLGFISAGTMVIPGVSGSMILMMLGYYEMIIQTINQFIKAVTNMNLVVIIETCKILIPFGIGVLIGIVIIAKIINKLLRKYPNATHWGIIGLIVASPFAILYSVNMVGISPTTWIISAITFAFGFLVAMKLSK